MQVQYGDRGVFVEYLQLALGRLGYSTVIDGVFGSATRRAVIEVQRANGLTADGIAGTQTWAVLLPLLRGYNYYRVKSGDTLWSIANAFYTSVSAIETANPNVRAASLAVGTRLVVPYGFAVVPKNVRYTYWLVRLLTEGLRVRYPFLQGGTIGTSVMGQNLYYFSMGRGNTEVFYNGSHHANEWITTPLLFAFLENYAAAYVARGKLYGYDATLLFDSTRLFAVPLVNPDGVDLVNGAVSDPYFSEAQQIAANYRRIPFPNGWKANIRGVDLNLNYPAYWERAREIKYALGFTSPAPRDFVGTAPLSAQESRAVYDFTREHDFRLTLSYHTQGNVIYWRFLDFMPPNSAEIAARFAAASGYALEETPTASGYAGYKDWYILTYNLPGYTIEVGSGENPLPLSQFNQIYRDNLGILTLGMAVFT